MNEFDDIVEIGDVLDLDVLFGNDGIVEPMTIRIVDNKVLPKEERWIGDLDVTCPIGKALIGQKVGSICKCQGNIHDLTITIVRKTELEILKDGSKIVKPRS